MICASASAFLFAASAAIAAFGAGAAALPNAPAPGAAVAAPATPAVPVPDFPSACRVTEVQSRVNNKPAVKRYVRYELNRNHGFAPVGDWRGCDKLADKLRKPCRHLRVDCSDAADRVIVSVTRVPKGGSKDDDCARATLREMNAAALSLGHDVPECK